MLLRGGLPCGYSVRGFFARVFRAVRQRAAGYPCAGLRGVTVRRRIVRGSGGAGISWAVQARRIVRGFVRGIPSNYAGFPYGRRFLPMRGFLDCVRGIPCAGMVCGVRRGLRGLPVFLGFLGRFSRAVFAGRVGGLYGRFAGFFPFGVGFYR